MHITQTHTSAEDGSNEYQDGEISFGLMEAIFKRPESYAASQGSQRGSGSVRSARSPSESLSTTSSSAGLRSVHASRSPSVCAESLLDPEGIPVPISSLSALVMTLEPTAKPPLEPEDRDAVIQRPGETIHETDEDDQHTPGHDIPTVLHDHPYREFKDTRPPSNSDVQVYY
jgi:hypothetical protein